MSSASGVFNSYGTPAVAGILCCCWRPLLFQMSLMLLSGLLLLFLPWISCYG
jgi:hypothetical protein